MFKCKWQKKYELAMETVKFWKEFHEEIIETHKNKIENHPRHMQLMEIHTAQKIALGDILRDMERIKES